MSTAATVPHVVDVRCAGSPREMGLAQGVGAANKIRGARRVLTKLEAFRLQQPRWLPYRLYRWHAGRRARRLLADPLARDYPAMRQCLEGIAEGARVGLNGIYLLNALEAVLSSLGGCTACLGACSAVAVRGRRTPDGAPMIARNFDYLPLVQPFYLLRESRPHGALRSLEFTAAPLAGAVDGMNERGLCITYNYAYIIDAPATPGAPISMAIAEALERCGTVHEAAAWISSRPRWGGGLLMLADAEGDIASLELSATRSHLRRPAAGEDVLFHTNLFAGADMQDVQVRPDAIYTERAPTPQRGRRVHQSSEVRNRRFEQLLDASPILDADALAGLMADHGSTGAPSYETICVHSDYWHTTACLQFFPKSRRMRVAYDTACRAQYQDVEL